MIPVILILLRGGGLSWVRHAMEHTGVPRWKISRLEETLSISDAVLDWS